SWAMRWDNAISFASLRAARRPIFALSIAKRAVAVYQAALARRQPAVASAPLRGNLAVALKIDKAGVIPDADDHVGLVFRDILGQGLLGIVAQVQRDGGVKAQKGEGLQRVGK